jgi:cytochrome c2
MRTSSALSLLVALGFAAGVVGCGGQAGSRPTLPASASASRGQMLIRYFGCGACHVIGGIVTATGHVGPPLTSFQTRYPQIAGVLPNTPQNLVRWIRDPQRFVPGVDMPDLGVGRQGAEDIAAYLYTQ